MQPARAGVKSDAELPRGREDARARGRQLDATPRPRRLASCEQPRARRCGPMGTRARVPAHRHRPGLRQREERRPGAARERRLARRRFITTKFFPGRRDPVAEVERSLEALGVDDVDLYIVHWPQGGPTWAWPGMEDARERGYARSIGVSNFDTAQLHQLVAAANVAPVVNQVQFGP